MRVDLFVIDGLTAIFGRSNTNKNCSHQAKSAACFSAAVTATDAPSSTATGD